MADCRADGIEQTEAVAVRRAILAQLRADKAIEWGGDMTSIPRDSDIVGAAALLAVLLVIGLARVFGW